MLLSIIIPIYNVEDTLRRCLMSVLPQVDNTMEVVLIDDGSTDSSALIAEEMIQNRADCTPLLTLMTLLLTVLTRTWWLCLLPTPPMISLNILRWCITEASRRSTC